MPDPSTRFKRSRAARERRQTPDRLGGLMLVVIIAVGVAVVFGVAYIATMMAA